MVDIPPKQCFCGRSASFPFCDGTHKIKKDQVDTSKDEE